MVGVGVSDEEGFGVVEGVWEWIGRYFWWEGEMVCGGEGKGDCDIQGRGLVLGRGLWWRGCIWGGGGWMSMV